MLFILPSCLVQTSHHKSTRHLHVKTAAHRAPGRRHGAASGPLSPLDQVNAPSAKVSCGTLRWLRLIPSERLDLFGAGDVPITGTGRDVFLRRSPVCGHTVPPGSHLPWPGEALTRCRYFNYFNHRQVPTPGERCRPVIQRSVNPAWNLKESLNGKDIFQ